MTALIRHLFSPFRVSILGYALFVLVGTGLLMLPISSAGRPVRFIDALFTSTSACCVTGLVVLDTGKDFSRFGQGVILVLIQVGGLGIMTLSTVALLLAGKRVGFQLRMVVQDTFTSGGDRELQSLIRDVVLFTLAIEFAGSLLLFLRFLPGREVLDALYLSVFHSVSAFCNAGFSLFSKSLEDFRGDGWVNLSVAFLIVSGGIGFLVLRELLWKIRSFHRTRNRLSLHTRLTLSTAAVLILGGTLLILLMEWENTLSPLPVSERILASFFQSVTSRTAGFNTLPIGHLTNQTLLFLILLMFIGASPGSTGGGIKTSSFATLVALGFSRLRGCERPQIFHRSISEGSVGKAMSVTLICTTLVLAATLVLQVTELGGMSHDTVAVRARFLELLFEVVSAFGTVGLSTGITPSLSDAGRLTLTFVMFLGRLGPLVVAVAVSRQRILRYHYAEEGMMIG